MRMRKMKNGAARFDAVKAYFLDTGRGVIENPAAEVGAKDAEVWLEIGAGKGGFAVEMAKRNPRVAYFAMERSTDCAVLAAERAKEAFPDVSDCRLRFVRETADNLTRIFEPASLDRIYLNFSDPWPKKGYAKRRLMHRRYLAVYFTLLKDGGTLQFKTDNDALFDFALEEIAAVGLTPIACTRDLHASPYAEGNVMTEYETAFVAEGKNINMVRLVKPDGFTLEIPDDLKRDRVEYRPEK